MAFDSGRKVGLEILKRAQEGNQISAEKKMTT
jgi:hypothetical protein